MRKSTLIFTVFLLHNGTVSAQIEERGSSFDASTLWGYCGLSLIIGGIIGFLIRDMISKRRRHRAREQHNLLEIKNIVSPDNYESKSPEKTAAWKDKSAIISSAVDTTLEPALRVEAEPQSPTYEWNMDINKTQQDESLSFKVMYFPNPATGGVFRKRDGRETFVEGASIYKFTLIGADQAEFEFCPDRSSVSIALNNRNELILNVAEELNPYNANANKLKSDLSERGKVKLEGNDWIITTKAKIKYI